MNKIFKVIWSHTTQSWVAVSELTKAHGKTKSVKTAVASALLLTAGSVSAVSVVNNDNTITGVTNGDNKDVVVYGKDINVGGAPQTDNTLVGSHITTTNSAQKNTVVGNHIVANTIQGTLIGHNVSLNGTGIIGIGKDIITGSGTQDKNALIGNNITTTNGAHSNSVLGNAIHVNSVSSTLIGSNISGNAHNIVGIGKDINISNGNDSIAIGNNVSAQNGALALGVNVSSSGSNGIAIGRDASSQGGALVLGTNANSTKDGVVIGRGAVNEYNYDTVIGIDAKSTRNKVDSASTHDAAQDRNPPAVVIGFNANSSSIMGDVVIGAWAKSSFSALDRTFKIGQATAIGSRATVYGDQGTALGGDTLALGNSSIAIGGDDINLAAKDLVKYVPTASDYIALRYDKGFEGQIWDGQSKIRRVIEHLNRQGKTFQASLIKPKIGQTGGGYVQTTAAGDASTAIGPQAMTLGAGSQAFGVNPLALGHSSIAMGSFATAGRDVEDGTNTVAIGSVSSALGNSSVAIGMDSMTHRRNDVAIGLRAKAGFAQAPVMTAEVKAKLLELQSAAQQGQWRAQTLTAIRDKWNTFDQQTQTAINEFLNVSIKSTMQANWKVNALTEEKLNASGFEAILAYAELIKGSEGSGETFPDAGQFKKQLKALLEPKEVGADAIAVGRDANAIVTNGIAIGTGAQVGNAADKSPTGVNSQKTNGIAIGKGSVVTGNSSIAVGVDNRVSGDYSGAFGDPSIVEGNASYTFGNNNVVGNSTTGAFVLGNNNQMGAKPVYLPGNQVDNTKPLTEIVDVSGSVAVGSNNSITTKDTFILGSGINMADNGKDPLGNTVENSVYLGKNSTAKAGAPTTAGTLKNIQENGHDGKTTTAGDKGTVSTANVNGVNYGGFAGATARGVVTVGAAGTERRIQNVAAGEISSTSTDAINGSQLYHTHAAINDLNNNIPFDFTKKDDNKPLVLIGDKYYVEDDIKDLNYDPVTKKFIEKTTGNPLPKQPTDIDKANVDITVKGDPKHVKNVAGNLAGAKNDTASEDKRDAPEANELAKIKNNAATVGDVLNAGWNLQGDSNPVDFVKPYDTVNFIDTDTANITVESADGKTSTIKIDVITTTLSNDEGKVDTPNAKDGSKLVNASTVVSAINESGWKVTIGSDKDPFDDLEGEEEKLITMGETATFRSGKNLKVKQDNANITFATEDDVEFNSVNATVFTVPGANTPDKSAVSISREGDVGKITLNGDGGAAAAITVTKGAGNLDVALNDQSERLVYTDSKGENQPIATMNDGLKFAGNNEKEATNSHKLGSTVNIVGERDDSLTTYSDDDSAKNNIMVDADGNNKLTVKLAKDLVNLKSVTTKDDENNTSVMNATGITITPLRGDGAGYSTGTGRPVSLTHRGLNNGGNFITNVEGHLPGAVSSGSTELITAPIKYGKLPEDWDDRDIKDNIKNDAATVGDVLNAGWNLRGPASDPLKEDVDFVRPFDDVRFEHGKNTRVTVANSREPDSSSTDKDKIKNDENTIKFDVDFPVAYTDQDGNPLAMDENGDFYKVDSDGNITPDQANGNIKISLINPDNQNRNNHETGDQVTLTNLKDNIGNQNDGDYVLPQTENSPFTKENFDANANGHNAATVNDVLNAGWNAYVDDAEESNFRALVNPADKVVFKGEDGVTVSAETESREGVTTFTFAADTAELTPIEEGTNKAGSIDALSDEEGKKLVNASTVANAINKAGFTLKASAVENEGTRDDNSTAGENGELINSGETVEMIAGKNLSVKHDNEGRITYATKENVEFTSIQFEADGPKIQKDDDGNIKVSDDGDNAVHITNLKGNFDGANNQAAPTKEASATNKPQEVTNAATVGDVLNAGWNLQENGTAKDFVRHADTVNFANGTGTTVSITPNEENDPTTSTIKVNLDFGTITSDKTTGAVTEVTEDNKVASTQNVAEAIRNSGWKLKDQNNGEKVIHPSDEVTFKNGTNTEAVVGDDGSVTINVANTALASDTVKKGAVADPGNEGHKLVNATTVAKAINESGWNVDIGKETGEITDQDGKGPSTVNPSEGVTFKAGKNLIVKKSTGNDAHEITFATNKNVDFESVQLGYDGTGPKLQKGDNGSIKVSKADGSAPVQITNVAAGAEKYTGTTTAKDGLTNLAAAPVNNALTVGDAQNMGWVVDTANAGTSQNFNKQVKNAQEVVFNGKDGVTVDGREDNGKYVVDISLAAAAAGSLKAETGATDTNPTGKLAVKDNKDGFVTAGNVAEVVNQSGWKLGGNDKDNQPIADTIINPGESVSFVDGNNTKAVLEVDPKTGNAKVKVNVETTALEKDPAKDGAVKTPDNGDKLVNATTVAKAINESGWNVDIGKETGDITDQEGKGPSTVNPSEGVTFKAGKNLIVKKSAGNDAHEITFATNKNVDFESVQLGYNGQGPKLTADNGNIKVGNKDGNSPVHITNLSGNLDPAHNVGDKTQTKGAVYNPNGVEVVGGAFTKKADYPTANLANIYNNAATVGDVLNSGWNLKANAADVDFVKAYDTVEFINGDTTTVSVTNTDGKRSEIKVEVQTTGLKVSDGTADTAVDGSNVAGDKGKVVVPTVEADKKKLVDAEHIANAINNSGFTLKTSKAKGGDQEGTSQDELITPGKSVEMIAGKNLKVKQEADGKVTYSTKDEVEFTSVQFGKDGPKISKGDNGEIKVSGPNGTDTVKITNVAPAAPKYENEALAPKNGLTNFAGNKVSDTDVLTVADAKTMGWIVSSDKKTSALGTAYSNNVTNAKEVKFVGEGDLVTVSGDDDGEVRKITIKVNSGKVEANTDGAATSGPDGLATTANVKEAINNSGWTLKDKAGHTTLVNPSNVVTFDESDTVTPVVTAHDDTPSVKFDVKTTALEAVKATDQDPNAKPGSIKTPSEEDGKKLVNATTVAAAINASGWNVDVDHDETAFQDKEGQGKSLVKAGETAVFKSGKNLKVKKDGTNITYATKDEVEFTSVQFGANGPKLTVDGNNIKVGDKDLAKPVHITNVAGNLLGAKKDSAAPTTEALSANKPTGDALNNVATVGDVLNAGWNLKENGTARDFVRHTDTVNFVNGTGTTVAIDPTDGTNSTVTVSVDFGDISANPDTGAVTSTDKNADKVASTKDVAEAIAASGWKLKDTAGKETIVNPSDSVTFKDSNTTSAVVNVDDKNAPYVTFEVKTTELKVSDGTADTVADGSNVAGDKGKVVVPTEEADKKKLVDAEHIANAINNAGFTLKTNKADGGEKDDQSSEEELITPGKSVEMVAGKNLKVKQEANGKVTYSTKDNVEFTSVQFGENGPKISKGDNGEIKVGDKDGNAVKITNVLAAAPKHAADGDKKGLTNLTIAEDKDVLTVADAKTMGWIVSTGVNDTDNTYFNKVTNAQEVHFVGSGGITVSGKDAGEKRIITIDIAKGEIGNQDGAATSGPNTTGFTTADDVKNAINNSGWKLGGNDKDGNSIGNDKFVNPGDSLTFADGNNTKAVIDVTDPNAPTVKINVETTALEKDPTKAGAIKTPTTDGDKLVNATKVAEAINNSGFNLKASAEAGKGELDKSGSAKPTGEQINPGDEIEMVAGKNMTVKHDKEGKITYSTKDEVSFTKVSLDRKDQNGQPDTTKPSINFVNEAGTLANNTKDSNPIENPTALNISSTKDGTKQNTQLTGVGSVLNTKDVTTKPGTEKPADATAEADKKLVDLALTGVADDKKDGVLDSAATVRDLTNMGWVVSTSKDGTETYSDTVKNANKVDFVGKDGVSVTGKTNDKGVREITISLEKGDVITTNNEAPVLKVEKQDGTVEKVSVTKVGDKYYKTKDLENGVPKKDAVALTKEEVAKVENTTNKGAGFVTGNQVGDAIQASGFTVGKATADELKAVADKFSKEAGNVEKVNPDDNMRFADGKGTVVSLGTVKAVEPNGVETTTTTIKVDVDLPIDFKYVNEAGEEIVKADDGKFYKAGDVEVKDGKLQPKKDANVTALTDAEVGKLSKQAQLTNGLNSNGKPNAKYTVNPEAAKVENKDKPIAGKGGVALNNVAWAVNPDQAVNKDQLDQTVNKSGFFVKQNGESTTANTANTEKVTPNDVVDFVNGTNTKVTAETKRDETTGVDTTTVKVDVSGDLTDITSIANGTTKISLGKDDKNNPVVNVNGAKITNVAKGDISPTSTDAVNGSQLYALSGGNEAVNTEITLPDGSKINAPIVKGDVTINVKDKNGNVVTEVLKDEILMKTYNVENRTEYLTNSAAEAINKMNEGGIKFFHVNNGKNSFQAQDKNSQDSSASAKFAAAIGYSANAVAESAIALGHNAIAGKTEKDKDGKEKIVSGVNAVAVGNNAQALGDNTVSIGHGNIVAGKNSGAFGDPSYITAKDQENKDVDGSYSIGNHNVINSINTFVLGNNVNNKGTKDAEGRPEALGNTVENSVYLGNATTATAGDKVGTKNLQVDGKEGKTTTAGNKGKVDKANVNGVIYGGFAGDTAIGVVSVGASGSERRIQNVAAGEISATSTDAINGSQLYQVAAKIGNINNHVNKLDKRMRGIGANVAAAASLPQVYIPGKSMISAAAGGYNGASAVAVGYSRASDNGKLILKLTGTANSTGQYSGGVGIGYQW